jgi:hypothetical protein
MRVLAVPVVAVVLLLSVAPATADTISFRFEDASYIPSPGDQDITVEAYLTNVPENGTDTSYGYYLEIFITGNAGVTFNGGATATTDHTPMLAWNDTDEFLSNGNQTIQLSVLTDMGFGSDVPIDDNDGLARLSIRIAGGTTGSFDLQFANVNTFPLLPVFPGNTGTNLHDDLWPVPGYHGIDSAVGTTVVPEPGTLLLVLLAAPLLLLRWRSRP